MSSLSVLTCFALAVLLVFAVTAFLRIKLLKKENGKTWLAGGIVALTFWAIVFIWTLTIALKPASGSEALAPFMFLIPGLPGALVISALTHINASIFGLMNNFNLFILISNIISVVMVFLVGTLIGKLVEKVIR